MVFVWTSLFAAVLGVADPGTVLTYEGRLAPDDDPQAGKTFEVFWLALPPNDKGEVRWAFLVEELGRGGWDWSRRFGVVTLSDAVPATLPSLRYEHTTGNYEFPLVEPIFAEAPQWNVGDVWEYHGQPTRVLGTTNLDAGKVFDVVTQTGTARRREIHVRIEDGRLVDCEQRIFMGRGEPHQLTYSVELADRLAPQQLAEVNQTVLDLAKLVAAIGPRDDVAAAAWSPEELERMRTELPETAAAAGWRPLERLLDEARRDSRKQTSQKDALAALARKAVGQELSEVKFVDERGQSVSLESLGKKVTVLHFWDYRDTPLSPPYGQIGFLDFLHRKRDADQVTFVGVVVNAGVAQAESRRRVVRSARKLVEFMNLSYPLVYDDGQALQRVGDPRQARAALPLFVVLDENERVLAYHIGTYQVEPNRGLTELDGIVREALSGSE